MFSKDIEEHSAKEFVYNKILKGVKMACCKKNKRKLIVASGNAGKLREIAELLPNYEVIGYKSLGYNFEIEENGSTFYENAYIKAKAVMEATNLPVLADDSGICVEALSGEPGIYSARYSKEGTDEKNVEFLLENLKGVPEDKRGAKFVCAMVMLFPDGKEISSLGETKGTITDKPYGENGFGYDPIFISKDLNQCLGLASPEDKNSISHRGRALRKIIEQLNLIENK